MPAINFVFPYEHLLTVKHGSSKRGYDHVTDDGKPYPIPTTVAVLTVSGDEEDVLVGRQ